MRKFYYRKSRMGIGESGYVGKDEKQSRKHADDRFVGGAVLSELKLESGWYRAGIKKLDSATPKGYNTLLLKKMGSAYGPRYSRWYGIGLCQDGLFNWLGWKGPEHDIKLVWRKL